MGFRMKQTLDLCVWLLLPSYVILDKFLSFYASHFPHLQIWLSNMYKSACEILFS